MKMIDEKLIRTRIDYFWGYGNFKASVWFVGIEEGCSSSSEELILRMRKTANATEPILLDVQDDMNNIPSHIKHFHAPKSVQKTWDKIIKIILTLQNKPINRESVIDFQKSQLGRKNSDHCLIELLPLPSRSTRKNDWMYGNTNLSELKDRRTYQKRFLLERANKLRELILEYCPKMVIFYSFTHIESWKTVVGQEITKINDNIYYAQKGVTQYFVIKHPVARGLSSANWQDLFNFIDQKIRGASYER